MNSVVRSDSLVQARDKSGQPHLACVFDFFVGSIGGIGFSQPLDANLAEPHVGAVLLESNMPLPLKVLQGRTKLVLRPLGVGVPVRLCPSVQVHIDDLLTVENDADLIVLGGNSDMVPLAVLCHFLAGSQGIVNRTAAIPAGLVDALVNLHFQAGLHTVLWVVGAKEDATVALGLELKIENEVAEALLGPNHAGFGLSGQHVVFDDPSGARLVTAAVLPLA